MGFERGRPKGPLVEGKGGVNAVDAGVDIVANAKAAGNDEDTVQLVNRLRAGRKTGTSVTFLPDIDVFKSDTGKPGIKFDPSRLKGRMDELAYLNPGLVLTLQDNRK